MRTVRPVRTELNCLPVGTEANCMFRPVRTEINCITRLVDAEYPVELKPRYLLASLLRKKGKLD